MSSTSECTFTPTPPTSSFITPSPRHSPIQNLSQTENLRGCHSPNRVPSGGNRIPGGEPTQRSHMVSGGTPVRHSHYSIHIHPKGESIRSGTPAPRQVHCVDQVGRKHVSTQLVQVQPSHLLQGVLPQQNRLSGLFGRSERRSDVKTKESASRFWKKKTKAVHNPCHSRAPLAPCLSFPVMMLSSISRLSSVDSIKILPKFHRPAFHQNKGAAMNETKESINLSPPTSSSRSPKIHKVVHKYRAQCHKDDKEFLRAFLKDDGDDLDGEDDGDEDQSPNPLKATLKFFKRIPRALDLPHPTRSSSFGSSGSSSSNDSSQQSYSNSPASQTCTSSVASSNSYSWNRAQHFARNRNEREYRLESLEL
jgi:hypothetical protein